MCSDELDVSWLGVGVAAAIAFGFFVVMLVAGVTVVHFTDPQSPMASWWAPATGSGTAILFILIVFASARRRSRSPVAPDH